MQSDGVGAESAIDRRGGVTSRPPAPRRLSRRTFLGAAATASGLAVLLPPTLWRAIGPDSAGGTAETIRYSAASASSPLYISGLGTTASPMGCFVDQSGDPMLYVGEDNWSLMCYAGQWTGGNYEADIDAYFAVRAAQGYNAVEVSMFSCPQPDLWSGAPTDGSDADGTYPFASKTDPSSGFNNAFWIKRDYLLTSALAHGFVVQFNVTTPSSEDTGSLVYNWTTQQWTDYGTGLGNRYKGSANLLWIFGDDYFGDHDAGFTACLAAMRAAGDNHPVSIQNYQESTSRTDIDNDSVKSWGNAYATWSWLYTYNVTYDGMLVAWNENNLGETGLLPTVWGDGFYLATGTTGITDFDVERRMIWWALTTGARGFTTGDNDIFPWSSNALSLCSSKTFYSAQMPAIVSTFKNLTGWYLLQPDSASQLVTGGRGTKSPPIPSSSDYYTSDADSYVTAARVPDGSLAVIYCAHPMSITIDETQMTTGYTATFVDPASGATHPTTPGPTFNATPLGNNSAGDHDWLLILQAPSSPASLAVGSFTPTSGPPGTAVAIQGAGFSTATAVAFNGTAAAYAIASGSLIQATVPSGATTGPISVTTPAGRAISSSAFTVTVPVTPPPPTISAFTPTSGPVGITVAIQGTGFTSATAVAFNGTRATAYTVASDSLMQATVPSGATTGPISVTTPSGTAISSSAFTVIPAPTIPAPTIRSFSPTSGGPGRHVTITGTNFTGAIAVELGTTVVSFTVISSTQITATVPAMSNGRYRWSVTTPSGTATSAGTFRVR